MPDQVAGKPARDVPPNVDSEATDVAEIVAACRRNDPDGLRRLMRAFGPAVNGLLRRIVTDPMTAEALAHEAFLKAYRAMDRFKDGTNLKVWLLTITRNAAYDHLRREKKERVKPVDLTDVPEPVEPRAGPDRELTRKEERQRVREAMETLPAGEREVVYFRVYQEWTWEQIGAALGIPEATARARMNRALERLRARL